MFKRTLTPDPEQRVYHSKLQLTFLPLEQGEKCEEVDNPVLATVLDIPGINAAAVKPYTLVVLKSPAWEWEPIEAKLLLLLSSFHTPLPQFSEVEK